MMKRTITVLTAGIVLMLGLSLAPVATVAAPSYPDAHYAWVDWKLRDNQGGIWLSDVAYSTVDPLTVNLRRPQAYAAPAGGPHYGASLENDNLNLGVKEGCSLDVDYSLLDGASPAGGAIRMFYYGTPYADTNTVAPAGFVAVPTGSPVDGTLSILFDGSDVIGTFGLVYDSSNGGGDSGIVSFTDLRLNCPDNDPKPIVFENRTKVAPPAAVIVDPSWVCGNEEWLLKLGSFTMPPAEGLQYDIVDGTKELLDSITVTETDPGDLIWVIIVPNNGYSVDGSLFIKYWVPSVDLPDTECPFTAPTTTPAADPSESVQPSQSATATATASASFSGSPTVSTTLVSGSLPVTGEGGGIVQKLLLTGGGLIAVGAALLILTLRRRKQDAVEQNV